MQEGVCSNQVGGRANRAGWGKADVWSETPWQAWTQAQTHLPRADLLTQLSLCLSGSSSCFQIFQDLFSIEIKLDATVLHWFYYLNHAPTSPLLGSTSPSWHCPALEHLNPLGLQDLLHKPLSLPSATALDKNFPFCTHIQHSLFLDMCKQTTF